MAVTIRLRRDTAANWTSANPTLALGEAGIETDTIKLKFGDGSTAWADLDYFSAAAALAAIADIGDVTITTPADNELLAYDNASSEWINQTAAEAGVAAASHNHAASDVNSGTLADARVAESNVTQHEAALTVTESQVSDLGTYATAANLTAHEGDTANPHSVTAAQADALPEDAGSVAVSATHTLLAANAGKVHEAVGSFTITLPDGLDTGYQAVIENHSSGTVTLSATTTLQKLTSGTGLETVASVTVDTGVIVRHKGSNVWVVIGDYT